MPGSSNLMDLSAGPPAPSFLLCQHECFFRSASCQGHQEVPPATKKEEFHKPGRAGLLHQTFQEVYWRHILTIFGSLCVPPAPGSSPRRTSGTPRIVFLSLVAILYWQARATWKEHTFTCGFLNTSGQRNVKTHQREAHCSTATVNETGSAFSPVHWGLLGGSLLWARWLGYLPQPFSDSDIMRGPLPSPLENLLFYLESSTKTGTTDGSNNGLWRLFKFVQHLLSFLRKLSHFFTRLAGFNHSTRRTKQRNIAAAWGRRPQCLIPQKLQ